MNRNRESRRLAAQPWTGPMRPYDLVKEFIAALTVVSILTVLLAVVFSSPDEKSLTLQSWAADAPADFVATATHELVGDTASETYGPPYNSASEGQQIGPVHLQRAAGVRIPVDPAEDFVLRPLTMLNGDVATQAALTTWRAATPTQAQAWASAYADALAQAPDGDPAKAASGDYGPVPQLASALLGMARSGALDSRLVDATAGFFQTDYTRPTLFLADGAYFDDAAGAAHLHGDQWGMMNELGDYPGQAWLWLYSFWYQVPPFTTTWEANADALIWALMMVLSLALLLVPFIPGLRSVPRWVGLHRLIWRDYYRRVATRP